MPIACCVICLESQNHEDFSALKQSFRDSCTGAVPHAGITNRTITNEAMNLRDGVWHLDITYTEEVG